MAGTMAAMRERPKVWTTLAMLVIVAGLALGPARQALAYTFDTNYQKNAYNFPRDTDGKVSESVSGLNGSGPPSSRSYHVYGRTSAMSYTGGNVVQYLDDIVYDWRETDYCTVARSKVTNHERAHSRGWAHGKENFTVNEAYYPSITCRP